LTAPANVASKKTRCGHPHSTFLSSYPLLFSPCPDCFFCYPVFPRDICHLWSRVAEHRAAFKTFHC